MRMRLRAPEPESSHEENEDDGNNSECAAADSSQTLPLLDVGSPEYIEERLENLKRRSKWTDFLDQYVQDHPESDSESDTSETEEIAVVGAPGFIRSVLWSLLVVALAPLLILCAPFVRHQGYGFWPLRCCSMKELFGCAVANVVSMAFGLGLLYWTICRELPDVFHVDNTLVKLTAQIDEILHAMDTCHVALLQWEKIVAQELCMPVAIDVALLLVNAYLLLHCHRRWARYLMALMVAMFVADVPTKLYDATFPAPEIHKVDPNYAMVNEELLVAVDGKNLKQGGSVAWVAYWGCAITSNVNACETQFASTFEAGNVAVTFKSIDHFIPCYRDPPNPLKAQEYQCFEHVRIRVKDKRSIPGWSRLAIRSPFVSQSVQAVTLHSIERRDGVRIAAFESDELLPSSTRCQDTIEPAYRKQDMVTWVESTSAIGIPEPSEYALVDNDRSFGLDNEDVELPGDGVSRANKVPGSGLEYGLLDAVDKEPIEAEVTPDAKLKTISLHAEPNMKGQSENTASSSQSLHAVSYTQKVLLDMPQDEGELNLASKADELEPMRDVTEVMIVNVNVYGETKSMDEELAGGTMTAASDNGKRVQTTHPKDQGGERKRHTKLKKTLE
ncbi:unnamed protein product [Hyaloperonospora brassicae]|uniref:Uncharacterized protein n=1 Tax=Hyaloperonospora brassicae TaxID=162125 RepID=A0AAV0UZD2_HYABA|nr:unnamed protein product [Hyaloperonospora brassicae]